MKSTSIRFQLLLAINALLAFFVIAFLAFDYRRELSERIDDKRVALEEEAKTLLPAVIRLRRDGNQEVQEYIDAVCARMRDTQSPGHHIAVLSEQKLLQAEGHRHVSGDMLHAGEFTDSQSQIDSSNLIVGVHEQGDVSVYVSEEAETLRASVFRNEIRRFGGLLLLAALAAVVVNVVLIRIVARPLDRLVNTVRSIGRGELDTKTGEFHSVELSYLASEIDAMSASLAAADQERTMQMAKARQIQQNLLPTNGATSGLRVSHVYEPATDVAGDYFDVMDLGANGCLFCIADVTGHGVPAAMSAMMLKTLLVQAVKSYSDPSEILGFINESFVEVTLAEDFATMLILRFDPSEMKLEYASAGHESGWLLDATGELRELKSTGMMLGVDPEMICEGKSIAVRDGDRLLAYTDGLPETFNAEQECLGRDSIPRLFRELGQLPVEEISDGIKRAADAFRGDVPWHDDLTFAVVELDQIGVDADHGISSK